MFKDDVAEEDDVVDKDNDDDNGDESIYFSIYPSI